MLKLKILTLFFAFKNLVAPCHIEKRETGFHAAKNRYKIERVGTLPDLITESSGLEIAMEGQSFWIHGDGGAKNNLYEINLKGQLRSIRSLPASNKDWEDITKDDKGNLYVGDFGNNKSKRRDLRIYKISADNNVDTIQFSYPDQEAFPPKEEDRNFDCEAIFWHQDHLYLVSKNRGHKKINFYKLPDQKGNYVAEVFIKGVYLNSMITAADISPDKKLVTLLSYGKIYFFTIEAENPLQLKPYFVKTFNRSAQSEAMVFINDSDLFISNEQGQLFLVKKKKK